MHKLRIRNELANHFFRRILLIENDAVCIWLVKAKPFDGTKQNVETFPNRWYLNTSLVARCVTLSVIGCLKRCSWTACTFSERILAARTNQSCWSWRNQQPINVFEGRSLGTTRERVIWSDQQQTPAYNIFTTRWNMNGWAIHKVRTLYESFYGERWTYIIEKVKWSNISVQTLIKSKELVRQFWPWLYCFIILFIFLHRNSHKAYVPNGWPAVLILLMTCHHWLLWLL